MDKQNKYSKIASQLLKHRIAHKKFTALEPSLQVDSIEEALCVHEQMILQRNDSVGGWKCLLPINEHQLIIAPIFSDSINRGSHCELFADKSLARVEPEIAFFLGKDLIAKADGYSVEEIDSALKSCHMALELMQNRYMENTEISFYEKLADCLVNQGLYIGPEIDKQLAFQASEISINIAQDELKQSFNGKHPNELPQKPLYWLINFMTKRGYSFKAGQAIITGSYAGIVEVDFDKKTEIEYVGLGQYSVQFKAIM